MEEQTTEPTTMKVMIAIGGPQPPEEFMQGFTHSMGLFLAAAKEHYKESTGQDLEFLKPTLEDLARLAGTSVESLIGETPDDIDGPAIATIRTDDDPNFVEVTLEEYQEDVEELMKMTGISRERAEEVCQAGEIPQDVKEKIVDYMVSKGNFDRAGAWDTLENGRKRDEWGATLGCECPGCQAQRAQVQAQRQARFN